MRLVRRVLLIAGCLAVLTGLVWIGQGTGVFPYPASSFMINQAPWITRGILLAIAGLVAVGVSRRM
jgi:hypothetical protein